MAGTTVRKTIKLSPELMAILDAAPKSIRPVTFTEQDLAFVHYGRQKGVRWVNIIKLMEKNGLTKAGETCLRRKYEGWLKAERGEL